ncbi:MAG: hypothetical protein LM514_05695 [Streptococcus sp.]|nr:hypothetical protein [Streptococcus sp.]
MLNPEIKQAVLQQWDNQWNPSPPPAPKSKWAGCKFKPSPEIAFIPELDDAQFEQLKVDIQAAAAKNTLAEFGKILLRKNQGTGWEIWDGRSRYCALVALGLDLKPLLKFVGEDSKRSMLSMAIKANVDHREWESIEALEAFLTLASAAMNKLANKDGLKK